MSRRITIDIGHGGEDNGALGQLANTPGIPQQREDEHNLTLGFAAAAELRSRQFLVDITRTKDVAVSLKERMDFVKALSPLPDLFITIHRDFLWDTRAHGVHTSFNNMGNVPDLEGKKLAEDLLQHVVKRTGLTSLGVRPRPTFKNGKEVESSLYVLRNLPKGVTGALIEAGFMSNAEEELLGITPEFVRAFAIGLADGVEQYFARRDKK